MNLKPPKFGRSRRLASLAAAGAISLGFVAAGLAGAGSAVADPAFNYVGVGSNTTQDVMNAFAATTGGGVIGNFDAVVPLTGYSFNTTPAEDVEIAPGIVPFGSSNATGSQQFCDFTRPNGSSSGKAALEKTVNPNFTGDSLAANLPPAPPSTTQEPGANCISFSRSSSAPSVSSTGDLLYLPFGGDVLATGTGGATSGTTTFDGFTINFVPTAITNANELSLPDLKTFYDCTINDTNGGSYTTVTVPDGDTIGQAGSTTYYVRTATNQTPPTDDASAIPVDLYVPQAGSGTRNFWLTTLTGTTTPNNCVSSTITNASAGNSSFVGDQVEENDGLAYTVDPNGLGPISVAQIIAQDSGHGEWRLGSVVANTMAETSGGTQLAPFTGTLGNFNASGGTTAGNAKINAMYPIWRLVYNVVLAGHILGTPGAGGTNGTTEFLDGAGNPDGKFDAGLSALFSSTGSLCQSSILIGHYGFATLPQATQAGESVGCGDTSAAEIAVPSLTVGAPANWPGF